jgi:hypothetical protein
MTPVVSNTALADALEFWSSQISHADTILFYLIWSEFFDYLEISGDWWQ